MGVLAAERDCCEEEDCVKNEDTILDPQDGRASFLSVREPESFSCTIALRDVTVVAGFCSVSRKVRDDGGVDAAEAALRRRR